MTANWYTYHKQTLAERLRGVDAFIPRLQAMLDCAEGNVSIKPETLRSIIGYIANGQDSTRRLLSMVMWLDHPHTAEDYDRLIATY